MRTELTATKYLLYVGSSLFVFLITVFVTPWIGTINISPSVLFISDRYLPEQAIFWQLRIPRMLLAGCAGLGLALAGAAFQSLLRNPLASPYVLGISAGSSLGAVLAIKIGFALSLIFAPVVFVFALIGSLVAIGVVFMLAQGRGGLNPVTLLLAGVTLNFFFSAIILLIQYLSAPGEAYQMIRWMMGAVDIAGYHQLIAAVIPVVIGGSALLAYMRALNILTLDEYTAYHLGVDVRRVQIIVFFAASFITAGVVSVCGPIGFIGLIIPHLVRLIFGADHRVLLPCSALIGGAFLIIADTLARKLLAPVELPVGVITAICGGPFFLFLLFHYRRQKNLI